VSSYLYLHLTQLSRSNRKKDDPGFRAKNAARAKRHQIILMSVVNVLITFYRNRERKAEEKKVEMGDGREEQKKK
jgi:hypothetical protein